MGPPKYCSRRRRLAVRRKGPLKGNRQGLGGSSSANTRGQVRTATGDAPSTRGPRSRAEAALDGMPPSLRRTNSAPPPPSTRACVVERAFRSYKSRRPQGPAHLPLRPPGPRARLPVHAAVEWPSPTEKALLFDDHDREGRAHPSRPDTEVSDAARDKRVARSPAAGLPVHSVQPSSPTWRTSPGYRVLLACPTPSRSGHVVNPSDGAVFSAKRSDCSACAWTDVRTSNMPPRGIVAWHARPSGSGLDVALPHLAPSGLLP